MNIDIATTIKAILVLLGLGVVISFVIGYRTIKSGQHLQFYRKRQDLIERGWRYLLGAVGLVALGLLLNRFGEPVAYQYFPPSPTITRTPTITQTPTITLTPIATFTPTITMTLSVTYTPGLPADVQATIQTPMGVNNEAVFSDIQVSTKTKDGVVVDPQTSFDPPVTHLFGGFSYDKMALGVQWSAVWLYGNEIKCIETKAWTYAPGGYGYTDCQLPADKWNPGEYTVQIFVGNTWKASGYFTITGAVPTASGTKQATPTPGATPTLTPSATLKP